MKRKKDPKSQIDDIFSKLTENPEITDREASLNFLLHFEELYSKSKAVFPCYMGFHYFEYWTQLFPFAKALQNGDFPKAVHELEDLYINKMRFYAPGVRKNILWLIENYVKCEVRQ